MNRPRNEPRQAHPAPGLRLQDLSVWPLGGQRVYRCHTSKNGPWYFSSEPAPDRQDPGGRWELLDPEGTCHVGDTYQAALWERFGPDWHDLGFVAFELLERHTLTEATLIPGARIADLLADGAMGITSELSTTSDYGMTRIWARAVRNSGWDGLRAGSRFAPVNSVVALFGPAGEHDDLIGHHEDTGQMIRRAREVGLLNGAYATPAREALEVESPDGDEPAEA